MNFGTTFGIATALMVMDLPNISHANDIPKSVMINTFCKNLNGGNIALYTDDSTKVNNKSCQAYFNCGLTVKASNKSVKPSVCVHRF